MSEYDIMLKRKRGAGTAIIVIGLLLGFMAFILDLLLTGEIDLGQTPLLLMFGGMAIAALGAAYIGAGTGTAMKKLSKQVKLMKNEINEKDKVIKEQQETLESLSDTRLKGLSETVDKMEFLAKSRTLTELPTKTEGQQRVPDLSPPKPKPEPEAAPPAPTKWEKKADEPPKMPPPPPKPIHVPKPEAPKDIPHPPTPSSQPPKPEPTPPAPAKVEEKTDELIEEEEEEEEGPPRPIKVKPELGADGIPVVNCPKCGQTIRGRWKECPFCDQPIELEEDGKAEEEEGEDALPKEEEEAEGAPAKAGLSILGYPSGTTKEGTPPKDIISAVLDEVMSTTPSVSDEKSPPKLEEDEEEEEEEGEEGKEGAKDTEPASSEEQKPDGPGPDMPPLEPAPEPEPVDAPKSGLEPEGPPTSRPMIPPGETISSDKGTCSNCGKSIKPHWRNCPYCKFALKPA